MMTKRSTLTLLAAVLLLSACGGTIYTRIRHPLHVGQVDPNQVPFEHVREERRRGLPEGTLVDQAELTVLNPQQICVRVTLWATQNEPQRADFGAYRIALLNDQSDLENTAAQIQLEQPMTSQYQGQRRVYAGGYSTRAVSTNYEITQQPATLCFPNGGFVTPATSHLTLELRGQEARNRLNFEWDFDSAVASAAQ